MTFTRFQDGTHLQRLCALGAITVTLLVLVPLLGIVAGIIAPPANPLVTNSGSIIASWRQTGLISLFGATLWLAFWVSLLSTVIGLWLAFAQQRMDYPGGKILSVLTLLPLGMPSYIVAATLREALGPGGTLGSMFGWPLFTGFYPVLIVLTLVTAPYVQLLASAALARLSSAEEEAARCLGCSNGQVFWQIIFPQLRPALAFAWLMSLLYVISDFGAVAVLDYRVLTWRLFQSVQQQQLTDALLLGVVLLLLTIPLLFIARKVHGHVPLLTRVSNPRPPSRERLTGLGLGITYGLHLVVIGLGVILPVWTLGAWVVRGWQSGREFASIWHPMLDTLWVIGLSACVIVAMALLPAWLAARGPKRLGKWVEIGTYLTSALPGVLLAFGLMLSALLLAGLMPVSRTAYHFLIGSGMLLFLGYAMRFMAEAYAGLKTTILAFDPRLTESAQILRASPWQWLTKIALPSLAPGMSAAFILVLLALIKELPVTLLLGGAMGLRTLTFRVFDRYQEAFFHDAGLAGLILLAISLTLVIISLRWRHHV